MASDIDICNLALAHLGDNATIASLDPPEGSAQAEHCARFYPMARDTLLDMHRWGFASKRAILSNLTMPWSTWQYCYGLPSDCMSAVAILGPDAANDVVAAVRDYGGTFTWYDAQQMAPTIATPQEFVIETLSSGTKVIYTNQENAILRYQAYVTDTTKFSPGFVMSLSWLLASMLAGPIVKGDVGAKDAERCLKMFNSFVKQAVESDSAQRRVVPEHTAIWINGR